MKIQILISTMHRDSFTFLNTMNLWGDILVINQCDYNSYEKITTDSITATIINTTQRGLSNSRNEALLHSTGDIILTADDDIQYYPDAKEKVLTAFSLHPEADIIAFNITRKNLDASRMPKANSSWKVSSPYRYYPSVSMAYRLSSIQRVNLWFHPYLGAGSQYSSGEESLLLREARKKGLRVYESPDFIATADFADSTWFKGYTRQFFFDKGAWLKIAYPFSYIYLKYYFLRLKKYTNMSSVTILKLLKDGAKAYTIGMGYEEYQKYKQKEH